MMRWCWTPASLPSIRPSPGPSGLWIRSGSAACPRRANRQICRGRRRAHERQTRNASITAASDGVFIDNEWRPSASGAVLDVIDPPAERCSPRSPAGNAQDVDAAVQAARRALSSGWGRMAAADRGRILTRAAALVTGPFDELAELEARDCGKPISQARADITATARYLEFYGGAADKVHGDMIPFMPGYFVTTEHVPTASPAISSLGTIPRRCSGAPSRPRWPWAMPAC